MVFYPKQAVNLLHLTKGYNNFLSKEKHLNINIEGEFLEPSFHTRAIKNLLFKSFQWTNFEGPTFITNFV